VGKLTSPEPRPALAECPPRARLDPTVKALGVVTMLNDLSSEVAVRTLPLFLANVLGVKVGIIGLIEGLAESTATLLKVVSGVLADRVGKKKALALWGYGLSGFTKPLLFFAAGWPLVLVVRVLDRIGKGIRTAPRDALIADVTALEDRGRAFGFNKAMDKAGAVAGLVLATGILYLGGTGQVALTRENYQALVLLSVVPGIASVFVLARWVRERPASPSAQASSVRLTWRGLDSRFRAYLVMLVIFTLGNSSDAFLMLRAQSLGFQPVEIFLLLTAFNLVITLSSTPAGTLSDRLGRRGLIVAAWAIYAVIYLGLAFASSAWHIWALYLGYGLYYGAFQGAASALVADLVPPELRGTAYGLFNGAIGVVAFPASLLAGLLWDWYGPPAPFLAGGALALVAALGMLAVRPQSRR
jgi:MFS family permease